MKYCIHQSFVKNETAFIKMWVFLKGVLLPSAKKKVKQKLVPDMHQDVTSFRRCFAAFDGKKVILEPLPYMG